MHNASIEADFYQMWFVSDISLFLFSYVASGMSLSPHLPEIGSSQMMKLFPAETWTLTASTHTVFGDDPKKKQKKKLRNHKPVSHTVDFWLHLPPLWIIIFSYFCFVSEILSVAMYYSVLKIQKKLKKKVTCTAVESLNMYNVMLF